MCGICGFNWDEKESIKNMIGKLKHRGPDDKGYYVDDYVSLGHSRLSIIDLSERGRQPIHNEDEALWIIFNGEIYNFKKIKKELQNKGHQFYTNTDTEVIIHLYEEYGYKCLNKFNGQFAFCLYDSNKKELFIARDRFGIKPFYFFNIDDKLIFASEIKSILTHNIKREVNKTALNEFLNLRFALAPNTLFKNIYKLKPAHYMIFKLKTKKSAIKQYYNIDIFRDKKRRIHEITNEVKKLLIDSVRLRMVADVPVASLLSGGIDSSLITGLMTKFNTNINTFSVGFENSSELKYAKIVSDYFNTNHHELVIKSEDLISNIPKMIYHMEEPIGDPGFFPSLLISKLASRYNKVVLSGEGADEIFGGYDKYKMFYYGRLFSKFIPKINYKNEIIKRVSRFSSLSDMRGYLETIRVFDNNELNKLLIKNKKLNKNWISKGNLYQKMQYFDIMTLLPEDFFVKADKMSTAYGLEERVPYMDHRLVEFAINLPTKLKLHFWNEKYIIKRAFSKFLPKVIIQRRKRGYNVPIDLWFKTILNYKFIELLKENHHKLYNKYYAFKLADKIKSIGENYKRNFYLAQKLWTLYVFEEWYNLFILKNFYE